LTCNAVPEGLGAVCAYIISPEIGQQAEEITNFC